ncbi:MAG: NAD(P)/FAD-dependent oxidoreductase [Clostridiales bacterium]|nr:NAD(P)/FAD-dependent oxidoreductase [Clostridiales bacterium]
MSKVAVVGGGAAGMMAAYAAGSAGHEVTLFEHNEKPGKKLYITGKGRCNLTNACSADELLAHVPRNSKFLYSAVDRFDPGAVMDFFEKQGLRLKVERGNRVFPQSDHSSDVIQALQRAMRGAGVRVVLQTEVHEIEVRDQRVCGLRYRAWHPSEKPDASNGDSRTRTCDRAWRPSEKPDAASSGSRSRDVRQSVCGSVAQEERFFPCDAVVMATGGISYPSTGSDGSGWTLVKKLGHTCTDVRPSLVGMTTKEDYITQLQGLALKNISFSVRAGKKKLYEEFGELLFTHQGISGPVVLTASSEIPDRYFADELSFEIDLKASLSEGQLDRRIQRDFEENLNRQYKNALGKLLPSKIIPVIIRLSGIDPEKKVNTVTKEERRRLLNVIKHFPGTITGLAGWREAIITRGGIRVKEVNPSTMESRLVPGLYLCGEMLDLDAVTGGFNLQIAWSTGYLAGISIKKMTGDIR